jgi:hypothetical protein
MIDESMQETCKSSSDEDDSSSSKPIILHKSKKSKHMLKPAGYAVMLKCIAVAEPLPKFHWFKVIIHFHQKRLNGRQSHLLYMSK